MAEETLDGALRTALNENHSLCSESPTLSYCSELFFDELDDSEQRQISRPCDQIQYNNWSQLDRRIGNAYEELRAPARTVIGR